MYNLYSESACKTERYIIGRSGIRVLFVIGLNPSTATQEKSDSTVAKVEEVARLNGYSGFVMLNLYPVRATDYNDLPNVANLQSVERNISAISDMVGATPMPTIWAAWGEPVMKKSFFREAVASLAEELKSFDPHWVKFGDWTANGHPRHPSRIAYRWKFSPIDILNYVRNIST